MGIIHVCPMLFKPQFLILVFDVISSSYDRKLWTQRTSSAPHAVLPAAPRKASVIRTVPPARGVADQGGDLGAEEAAPALGFPTHGRGPEEGGMCHAALRAHQCAGRGEDGGVKASVP